jgi:hypothetical protein
MSLKYLELYRNRETNEYLIQRYSGMIGVGHFVKVSNSEMSGDGLRIVLSNLALQVEKPDEPSELQSLQGKEERAFYKNHPHVFVSLSNDELAVGPLIAKGSGFVAPKDFVVRLPASCTNEEFVAALHNAYSLC